MYTNLIIDRSVIEEVDVLSPSRLLVRLTIVSLIVLGFQFSALYFLPMILLLNTHHREFFGW